jgi:hypothetical protein
VAAIYQRLLAHEMTLEEADEWARPYIMGDYDDTPVEAAVWQAIVHLSAIDTRHSADGPYLHTDDQIREWLDDLLAAPDG